MGRNHKRMSAYTSEHPSCELCGSSKGVECHHILPMCLEGYGVDFDVESNYISVCRKCHALLTPKDLLSKYGVEKSRHGAVVLLYLKRRFYKIMGEILDSGNEVSAVEACDIFDKAVEECMGKPLPSDYIPVIRCKNCLNYLDKGNGYGLCQFLNCKKSAQGYCDYGIDRI